MPYVRRTKRRPSVSRRLKIIAVACAALAVVLVLGGLYAMQQERIARGAQEAASFTPAPLRPSSSEVAEEAPTFKASFADVSALPATSETGHTLRTIQNGTPGAAYQILDGKLTNSATDSSPAAAYLETELDAPVTKVGAKFTFEGDSPSGSVMIGVWQESIVDSFPAIPASPAHFVITPTGWIYGVWNAETGENEILRAGDFEEPLATDGQTVHEAEVTLDGDQATVQLPDGTERSFSDPRIAERAGAFPCFEVFQNSAAENSRPAFLEVWAS